MTDEKEMYENLKKENEELSIALEVTRNNLGDTRQELNKAEAEIEKWQEQFRYLDFECERLEKEDENQRMEIEKLQEEIELLHTDYTYKLVKRKAKAEAIREFAERLKERIIKDFLEYNTDTTIGYIDNLIKEMVGDGNV